MSGVSDKEIETELTKLLEKANHYPYLFVGSGMSKRYMGLPNWQGLLEWVCQSVDAPMLPWWEYAQKAKKDTDGVDYPYATSLMEEDFQKAIYSTSENVKMKKWAQTHSDQLGMGKNAMKIYIAEYLAAASANGIDDNLKNELALLKKAGTHIAGIITTNYDKMLERCFPDYDSYASQSELLFSSEMSLACIYKIHGTVTDPESMVLDKSDYQRLTENRQYLESKIMTIFGEYPVIFLGYSIKDEDIRSMISSLVRCAGIEKACRLAERFVFVEWAHERSSAIEQTTMPVDSWGISMTKIRVENYEPIYNAIFKTSQAYSPKVVKQITRELFVESHDQSIPKPERRIAYSDLEGLDALPSDWRVVIGVEKRGNNSWGKPIDPDDIYEDIVFDDKKLDPQLIVNSYLATWVKKNRSGFPMFKYLSEYKGSNLDKCIEQDIKRYSNIGQYRSPTENRLRDKHRKAIQAKGKQLSVQGLIDAFGESAYKHLVDLNEDEINIKELSQFLQSTASDMKSKSNGKMCWKDTNMRKDIRIYDHLKYRTLCQL